MPPLTLLLWFIVFAALALLSLRRAAWGAVAYFFAFFACPSFWWWGSQVRGMRWSLYSGIVFLIAALLHFKKPTVSLKLPLLILFNATFVHFIVAGNHPTSLPIYTLLAKFVLLHIILVIAIQSHADLRLVLLALVLGAAYIGYEVTINDVGKIVGGRLERVGAPGATGANQLASLMATILPICGYFFLTSEKAWQKCGALLCGGLITNVILLCNSRGCFLACISSAVVFVAFTPKHYRVKLVPLSLVAVVGLWVLLGDARIVERFMTTFEERDELDTSAANRLLFWKAGINMAKDYPLGMGGQSFKRRFGLRYLLKQRIYVFRAIHNGFINEACEWGFQGLALRLLYLGAAAALGYRMIHQRDQMSLLPASVLAGIVAFSITCLFGDFLDSEWGYWLPAIMASAAHLPRNRENHPGPSTSAASASYSPQLGTHAQGPASSTSNSPSGLD